MQDLDSFSQRIDRPPLEGELGILRDKLVLQDIVLSEQPLQRLDLFHTRHPTTRSGHQAQFQGASKDLFSPAFHPAARDAVIDQELRLVTVGRAHVTVNEIAFRIDTEEAFNWQGNQLLKEMTDSQPA